MMTDWLYFTVATTVTECAFEKQLQISNISVKPIYILKMTKHSGSRDVTFHQFSVEPKLSGFQEVYDNHPFLKATLTVNQNIKGNFIFN